MSDYTKLNLRDDVEDMAVGRMPPGIEAHFAKQPLGLEKSGLTYYKFGPDFHPPFGHRHAEQEEIYIVLSGSATVKVEDEEVTMGPLDAIRLPSHATRAVRPGPDGCEVLAFGAPKLEEQDAEVIPDWWSGPDS